MCAGAQDQPGVQRDAGGAHGRGGQPASGDRAP